MTLGEIKRKPQGLHASLQVTRSLEGKSVTANLYQGCGWPVENGSHAITIGRCRAWGEVKPNYARLEDQGQGRSRRDFRESCETPAIVDGQARRHALPRAVVVRAMVLLGVVVGPA